MMQKFEMLNRLKKTVQYFLLSDRSYIKFKCMAIAFTFLS